MKARKPLYMFVGALCVREPLKAFLPDTHIESSGYQNTEQL